MEPRKCGMAGSISGAILKQQVKRMLCTLRERKRLLETRRSYAQQEDSTQMLRMLAHVNLGSNGSVRSGYQVDSVVAHGRAHFIQIVHGYGSRVEAEIGDLFETLATIPHLVRWQQRAEKTGEIPRVVAQVTIQRI